MTHLLLEYDESVDAAYLQVSEAPWHRQERVNDMRAMNYAEDGSVIGIGLLSPHRIGVNIDGLPHAVDVERVMRARGFRILQGASQLRLETAVELHSVQKFPGSPAEARRNRARGERADLSTIRYVESWA